MTEIMRVTGSRFTALVTEDDQVVTVRLAGNADVPVQGELAKVVTAAHQHAQQRGHTRVNMDIRELSFMTSACLKEIITWLDKAKTAGGSYQITFLSSSTQSWQRRTLHALTRFAQELVTIQVT